MRVNMANLEEVYSRNGNIPQMGGKVVGYFLSIDAKAELRRMPKVLVSTC